MLVKKLVMKNVSFEQAVSTYKVVFKQLNICWYEGVFTEMTDIKFLLPISVPEIYVEKPFFLTTIIILKLYHQFFMRCNREDMLYSSLSQKSRWFLCCIQDSRNFKVFNFLVRVRFGQCCWFSMQWLVNGQSAFCDLYNLSCLFSILDIVLNIKFEYYRKFVGLV